MTQDFRPERLVRTEITRGDLPGPESSPETSKVWPYPSKTGSLRADPEHADATNDPGALPRSIEEQSPGSRTANRQLLRVNPSQSNEGV